MRKGGQISTDPRPAEPSQPAEQMTARSATDNRPAYLSLTVDGSQAGQHGGGADTEQDDRATATAEGCNPLTCKTDRDPSNRGGQTNSHPSGGQPSTPPHRTRTRRGRTGDGRKARKLGEIRKDSDSENTARHIENSTRERGRDSVTRARDAKTERRKPTQNGTRRHRGRRGRSRETAPRRY